MKEIIDLQKYKITNNPTTDKENKKVNDYNVISRKNMECQIELKYMKYCANLLLKCICNFSPSISSCKVHGILGFKVDHH